MFENLLSPVKVLSEPKRIEHGVDLSMVRLILILKCFYLGLRFMSCGVILMRFFKMLEILRTTKCALRV